MSKEMRSNLNGTSALPRTITVTGTGRASAAPDYVTLSMTLEAKDKDYETAMELAAKQIGELRGHFVNAGFGKEDLKTESFDVRTEYERVPDEKGNYHNEFSGYVCVHALKLAFDLDMKRLSAALTEAAASSAHPQISVSFTLKDPSAVNRELLRSAAENAKEKAEILCAASNAALGTLLSVSYQFAGRNYLSPTRYAVANDCLLKASAPRAMRSVDLTPENIDLNDSSTFVWEII